MPLDNYGFFTDDGREFVITRPDTPAPWVNYISNSRYTGLVSNTGGGFSYWMDPRDSRITRFRYNCLPWDRPGRYVYLKDIDDVYWSLSWQPTAHNCDQYECRVGMGYQTIRMLYRDVRSEITYFVPLEDDLEIWLVKLRNESLDTKRLQVFSYVELCLGHALVDLINQPNDQHFNIAHFDRGDNAIYATKNYWVTHRGVSVAQPNQGWDRHVVFTTDLPVQSWDCLKDAFIGKWRSEQNPIGIEHGVLSNTDITAGDACAALHSEIILEPREEFEFVVLMGCVRANNYQHESRELIRKYRRPVSAVQALDQVRSWWDRYLSSVVVETPDREMNLVLNVWGKRQAWVTFNCNRNAGYYHGGLLFGVGIRDQCQDMMGPLLSTPEAVAERLLEVLSHQFQDGSTLHNYFKLTGQGEKTGHSDTPLWLPFAVVNYLKETADWDFLKQVVPFQDGGEAVVLEHVLRAVDYVLSQLTENHLPKFGPGDWNDTLDYVGRKGRGESVWVAHFLCYVLRECAELLEYIAARVSCPSSSYLNEKAHEYRREYELVKQAVNERCWDGEWYIRGIRDDGDVIGSKRNKEGRIFMNAQSWAVISGVADKARGKLAMDSADRLLITQRGPKILSPSYTQVDPGIGLATRCVPGKKENGAIFNHVAAWSILANTIIGEGNRAYEYFRKTMPMVQAQPDPDLYKMEPYVYSEYVTSDDHPTFGQASHSWLTGSAVWMLRTGLDWILGLRPTYDGLILDPCIPSAWNGFRIVRRFRGAVYEVEVQNPEHIQHGVARIEIDGTPIEGKLLPLLQPGSRAHILCIMGKETQ
ncbi:MAG: glycosyl transferase family 36 [Armatimonadota bacterium]|nr:glycosyl transferase family 36 [Armatimonadota bacterium]